MTSGRPSSPLSPEERAAILERPRTRSLQVLDGPDPTMARRRHLPLAEARASDAKHQPILAVWEITLRCDLACRHCGSRAGKAQPDELSTQECVELVRQLAERRNSHRDEHADQPPRSA